MEQGSIEKLKFDNRLNRRKGWVSKSEKEAFLESLPDVSDKISTPEDEESAAAAGAETETATESAAPASESPADALSKEL